MGQVRKRRSGPPSSKRLHAGMLRDAVRSVMGDRAPPARGVIRKEPGQSQHFELDGDTLLVQVQLAPHGERLVCLLSGQGGHSGLGVWYVPPEGTECYVIFPDEEFESDPIAILRPGTPPNDLAPGKLVIREVEVLVRNNGTAVSLALKSDVQALRDALTAHTHAHGDPTTGPGPTLSNPAGTTVLKGQ